MAESFVIHDSGVDDALIFTEDTVGKRAALPSHLQTAIWKIIEIDVLTAETFRDPVPFEDDLLAVIGYGQLLTDVDVVRGGTGYRATGLP